MTEPDVGDVLDRLSTLRANLADEAELIARLAEQFATVLERSAARGDEERRLTLARVEREIAEVERRNADRLRARGRSVDPLEPLPKLPAP